MSKITSSICKIRNIYFFKHIFGFPLGNMEKAEYERKLRSHFSGQ
eukprot:gene9540-1745_t